MTTTTLKKVVSSRLLKEAKVEEWMQSGEEEVVRVLTWWATQKYDMGDDEWLRKMAFNALDGYEPKVEKMEDDQPTTEQRNLHWERLERSMEKVQTENWALCLHVDVRGNIQEVESVSVLGELVGHDTLTTILRCYDHATRPCGDSDLDDEEPWKDEDTTLLELFRQEARDWWGYVEITASASRPDWPDVAPYIYIRRIETGYQGGPDFDYYAVRVSVLRNLLQKKGSQS